MSQDTRSEAERVAHIQLEGAPLLFVLDAGAIWGGQSTDADTTAGSIIRKLRLLVQREPRPDQARVVVRGADASQRQALAKALPSGHLVVDQRAGPVRLEELLREQGVPPGACLAALAEPGATVPPGCLAFSLGPGEPPDNAHAPRHVGPAATDAVLALYGTALAQERAGVAFRATSLRQRIPDTSQFDPGILRGIIRAEARPPAPAPAAPAPLPDEGALRTLAADTYTRLRRNLQPNGAVAGSPARGEHPGEPNYWFFWQRDGAATMGWLIDWQQRGHPTLDTGDLSEPIGHYLDFIARIQRHGHLGTSRYTIAGEPVLGYGNPQLDGPALTVLAMARLPDPTPAFGQMHMYLDFLLTPEGQGATFDAWEFVYGRTFNALLLRQRALRAGADVALALGRTAEAARYATAAQQMGGTLEQFVDAQRGRLIAYRETRDPWFEAISGLDMGIIAALLANWQPRARGLASIPAAAVEVGHDLTSPAHPAVLATMAALEDAFAALYQVNRDWRAGGNAGWGLGRFPEDANDGLGSTGGNPWPLTTLWGAQFYYRLAQELGQALASEGAALPLDDPRQVAFLNHAAGRALVAPGRPVDAAAWRAHLLPALVTRGDGYLSFVVAHLPADGGVTEQIDCATGQPRGASDLSWALAELIGTIGVREEARALQKRRV